VASQERCKARLQAPLDAVDAMRSPRQFLVVPRRCLGAVGSGGSGVRVGIGVDLGAFAGRPGFG
jgi:hypothetical protein